MKKGSEVTGRICLQQCIAHWMCYQIIIIIMLVSLKYCRSFSVEHSRYTSYTHYLDATFFKPSWFTEMKDEVYCYGNLCVWISTAALILYLNLTAFEALIEENCFAILFSSLCGLWHIVVTNSCVSQTHYQNLPSSTFKF